VKPDYTNARLNAAQHKLDALATPPSAVERDALAAAQMRADAVAAHLGTTATPPIAGESSLQYRKRVLTPVAARSERFKGASSASLAGLDAATLGPVEDIVYADAIAAAKRPENYAPGELRAVAERDTAGRLITKFYGDIGAWMAPFTLQGASVRINRDKNK
jgi:hypothetical protein